MKSRRREEIGLKCRESANIRKGIDVLIPSDLSAEATVTIFALVKGVSFICEVEVDLVIPEHVGRSIGEIRTHETRGEGNPIYLARQDVSSCQAKCFDLTKACKAS